MDAFIVMLKNVIIFVLLALPGYLLVKTKEAKPEQSGVLSKLLMYVGMPFLILTNTIDKIHFDRSLLALIGIVALIGVAFTFVMFFVSGPLTKSEREAKTRGMMRFSAVFANNGFLGIPLAIAVFGADSMVLTVVIILNIISNVLMFTLGVYLISGDRSTIRLKKAFLNPVLLAFLAGIVLNLCNVKKYLPEISSYATHFSNIVTPVSMVILGMKMGGVKFLSLFRSWRTYYISALRLAVFPAAIVALLFGLRALGVTLIDTNVILGTFIAFATPTAGLASTFSDRYDGDTENAVAFTLGTTVLSTVTLPVLYWLLCSIGV